MPVFSYIVHPYNSLLERLEYNFNTMNKTRWIDTFRANLRSEPPSDYDQAMREVRPFYWFLIFGMVIQYGFTMYFFADKAQPVRWFSFTILMLLHGGLHWVSPHLTYKTMLTPFYVLIQSALAFIIVLISNSIGLTYGLFAPLLGEIIGMFRRSKISLIYGVFFLLASFLSYLVVSDFSQAWEWIITAIPIAIFVWLYVFTYTNQVEARERAQDLLAELEEAHQQLSEYASQVEFLTLTTERQRMARELHDTLAQGLAGLILQLEAVDSHISAGHTQKAQSIIQQAMGRARTTLADARRAIGDLRESQSSRELVDSLQEQADRFTHDTGIPCEVNVCSLEMLSPEVAQNALRAVSEGLINIARHANATQAVIEMSCDGHQLEIEIRDDGIGFDPQDCVGRAGHFGLLGMRERARILGGSLSIESCSSRGSTLKLELPIEKIHD